MPMGVVSNEDVGFQDKPFVVADASTTSPKRDWVYVTWTRIGPEEEDSPDGIRADLPDHVQPVRRRRRDLVRADRDQRRGRRRLPDRVQPRPRARTRSSGPDGTIYVSFANDNAIDGGSQILMVKCPADEDCTEEEAWTEPVIVSDLDRRRAHRPERRRLSRRGASAFRRIRTACPRPTRSRTRSTTRAGIYIVWADFRNNTNPALHGLGDDCKPRPATTMSSTRTRRTRARPGASRSRSRRARMPASARPRNGSRGAR